MCSPLVTQCLDEPSASLLPAAPLPTRPRPCARHEYHRRKLRSTLTVPCVGAPTAMAGAERLSGAAARLRHRPPEPSSPVKAIEVHTAAPMALPLDAPTSRAHRQGPRASPTRRARTAASTERGDRVDLRALALRPSGPSLDSVPCPYVPCLRLSAAVTISLGVCVGEVTQGIDFSPFRLHTKEGVDSQSTMIVDV